jgi:hypothetical protein
MPCRYQVTASNYLDDQGRQAEHRGAVNFKIRRLDSNSTRPGGAIEPGDVPKWLRGKGLTRFTHWARLL